MKKLMLFISLLLVFTFSLSFVPPMVSAEDKNGLAEKSDFVGNLTCGSEDPSDTKVIRFHQNLPTFTSRLYDFLKIATPVIIIITGMLDIVKAVTAQKEDDMKKAQKKLINRLIAGAVVFLVFFIVEIVIELVADNNSKNAMDCVNCFLNNTGCDIVPEN